MVIIEIKRADHAVTIDDLQRLEKYKERLSRAHDKDLFMVMICGGPLMYLQVPERIGKNARMERL